MDCIIIGCIFMVLSIGALIAEERRHSAKRPRTFKEIVDENGGQYESF